MNLIFKQECAVNDKIKIMIPTVGEILDNEDEYYNMVSMLTAMPIDYMVQLDDIGYDFEDIGEYDFFLMMFAGLQSMDTRMIFGDLDLTLFELRMDEKSDMPVLYDSVNDIKIDRGIQCMIAATLRKIHHLEKNNRKPANKEAKEYMIERARKKMRRRRNHDSEMESLIVAMVNKEQFKYDFKTVRDITIYQFNESVRQVIKVVEYNNKMRGIYAGTVKANAFSQDDLNWLIHK